MTHGIKAAALAGAAIAALLPLVAAAQTVGVNAAVVNDVRMTTDANHNIHQAVVRERVSLGNDIVTGGGSRLQVLLLDKTNFTVGPNARLKVDRFVYDPDRQASSVGMTIAQGAFRFMSGKPTHANPGQSAIHTPVASIGIRGTIVEGVVGQDAIRIAHAQAGLPHFTADPQLATLILLRGPGPATQGGETPGAIDVEAGGKTVTVDRPGMALFVPGPGQAPIGPFALSDWGSAALARLLGTPGSAGSGLAYALMPFKDPLTDLLYFDEFCTKASNVGIDAFGGGGCGGVRILPP